MWVEPRLSAIVAVAHAQPASQPAAAAIHPPSLSLTLEEEGVDGQTVLLGDEHGEKVFWEKRWSNTE